MTNSPVVDFSQQSSQSFTRIRRQRILLACTLISALILLTIGLQDLNLRASAPIHFVQGEDGTDPHLKFLLSSRAFIAVVFILFSFILLLFIPRITRKWGIILLAGISALALLFYFLSSAPAIKKTASLSQNIATPALSTGDVTPVNRSAESSPPAEFHPPQIPNLFLYLISLAVTLSVIFIVWMVVHFRRSPLPSVRSQSLEEIGEAARLALDDMAAGLDEKDAVIHCYARMSDIVLHSQNIERGASRTAAEFAIRLEAAGLPGDSVRRLTRLFESVRYGTRTSRETEVEEARECLADIARFCGEAI